MALFDTYSRSSKEIDAALKEKLKKKTQPKKNSKSNNLLTRVDMIKDRVEKNLGEYKNDYKILIKDEEIIEYFDHMLANGICAIDTETTGLNIFQDKVVGICLYT